MTPKKIWRYVVTLLEVKYPGMMETPRAAISAYQGSPPMAITTSAT